MRMYLRPWMLVLLSLVPACSTIHKVDEQAFSQELGFLKVGEATRTEIIARLGGPDSTYEDNRIVTYQMNERDGRLYSQAQEQTQRKPDKRFCLVLVYRLDNVLARKSLVRVE